MFPGSSFIKYFHLIASYLGMKVLQCVEWRNFTKLIIVVTCYHVVLPIFFTKKKHVASTIRDMRVGFVVNYML